jgi:hypothetical protein
MTAAVEAYLRQPSQSLRILITAGTYTAIDNVVLGVCDSLSQLLPAGAYELYRIRSKFRPAEDEIVQRRIDLELNRYHPSPALSDLRKKLVNRQGIVIVGMTSQQVHNFIRVGSSAQEELFDLLVLDEASQIDIEHAILPLCSLAADSCVVLAGDDLQLAPIQKAEPPKDLEDLVGSAYNFYKRYHNLTPRSLNVNYRSNRTIVDFCIRAGYSHSLRPYSPNVRLNLLSPFPTNKPPNWPDHLYWTSEWSRLLDPDKPAVCFVHDDMQSSQSNFFEADAVAVLLWLLRERISRTDDQFGLLNDLDEQGRVKPVSSSPYDDKGFWSRGVGVVTPHRAQVGRIISSLARTFPQVTPSYLRDAVDTVERFQGQQRDIMIGSFALGDPDAIRNEDEFLYNLNRFNVMASRARAKLILLVSQTVVDHLSNDLETLRDSRLVKLYVDSYCNQEVKMQLGYLQPRHQSALAAVHRQGRFKYHV